MIKTSDIPHVVKYMGSKRNLIDFVFQTIQEVDPDGQRRLYDVFAGSAVVSAAFRNVRPVSCNDVQHYSGLIGRMYLQNYCWEKFPDDILERFLQAAKAKVDLVIDQMKDALIDYDQPLTFAEVSAKESVHRKLINSSFTGFDHVFIQRFSGTYWSLRQCIVIDAIISTVRTKSYRKTPLYELVHGALMFAMAYCSQSTGHYAQYRDLTEDNLADILLYRRKSMFTLFEQKLYSLRGHFNGMNNSAFEHETTNLDFLDAIRKSTPESIIYADPPYQFVHYSRFYHALETLVRYDYPEVRYKGRYRTDRHQSPFCIKTKVRDAFRTLFEQVAKKRSTLILSYSDNGMISKEALLELAKGITPDYIVTVKEQDYLHSTMGRQKDKYRSVKEVLIAFQPSGT